MPKDLKTLLKEKTKLDTQIASAAKRELASVKRAVEKAKKSIAKSTNAAKKAKDKTLARKVVVDAKPP